MSLTKILDSTTDLYHPIRHWNQKDLSLLTGEKGQYKLALRWQVALVQAGYQVFNLDCAVRFNPFLITAETRLQNIPPEPFFRRDPNPESVYPLPDFGFAHCPTSKSKARYDLFSFSPLQTVLRW